MKRPCATLHQIDPILHKSDSRIKTFYLNKILPIFMTFVNCKVFLMTVPDFDVFYLKRSIKPVHYIYVSHAIASTIMTIRHGALDHYDSILCVGPYQIKEIRRHEELNNLNRKVLVKAGYYRLERIYEAYRRYSQEKPSSITKKTILIAPSWGDANVIESCGEHLIEILLEASYKVIVRPHPETIRRSPGLIASFASKFGNNPDFILEMSVTAYDSLLQADVIICDYSGVVFEYAFGTERPVLFLDVPVKVMNKRFKELGIDPIEFSLRPKVGVVISPKKLETVPQVISNLIANREAYKKRIAELRGQYVYAFGHSSEVGARHIISLL